MKDEERRYIYLDVLKILACFFVLVNHTNSGIFLAREPSRIWYISLIYFFAAKTAVPLFLMASGVVLLGKEDSENKRRKRITRCIQVILIFTLFYLFDAGVIKGKSLPLQEVVTYFLIFPTNALWYLYLYLAILLFLFVYQKLSVSLHQKEMRKMVLLSIVLGGVLPMMGKFHNSLSFNPYFYSGMLSVSVGLLFAGFYIEKFVRVSKSEVILGSVLFSLILAFDVLCTRYIFYPRDPAKYLQLDDRSFLNITASAICVFIIIKGVLQHVSLSSAVEKRIEKLSSLTFGIYLLGDWFISLYKPVFIASQRYIPVMAGVVMYEMAVFISGAVLTILLKRIPFLKRLL